MNSTNEDSAISNIKSYYIICSLSAGFGLISIIMSMAIIIIIRRSKPRLHTVRHLLMCNTCIASIVYCIVQTINYSFLIFLPWETGDIGCQWRGYFGYMTISAATYSYLVQATSRLFFARFSTKYPWLLTFKTHYYLILIHWIAVLIIPLSSVITKDIRFRPGLLCWVPLKYTIHVAYTVFGYYFVPIASIMIIYIYIYKRIKNERKRAKSILHTVNEKRDLEVLRNIVILLFIYITGGVSTMLFLLFTMEIFYLAGIVTFTLAVTVEKICTILLDRELRQVVWNIIYSRNRVTAFENTITQTRNAANAKRV
ncbi:unnamed protein product [Rotaria sordida]|uniref:G-protein coupled receptors family 1 profile domain-containing protein n=1 Tax=Rotaria sordida TaxID=392033 RepID=A0A814ESX7_9BILA|nr:unnamed protein product [Rotaria sordida]CAF1037973.1 unnamed protein product [Rotaria sordida]